VRLQVRTQCIGDVAFQRPRRNHVARPSEHGHGDEQRIVRLAIVLDHQRLAVGLGHVGERPVCVRVILLQMVECGVERRLVAVANDLREQRIELRFPKRSSMRLPGQRAQATGRPVCRHRGRLAIRWHIKYI
jgi:hypothetical protein